jgi:short-subunit dehydrogenase
MSSLRDQVAQFTGIGAAIAKSFAQQGAKVAVHGRDGAALSSSRREIELAGWRASVEGNLTATFLTVKSFLHRRRAARSRRSGA